MNSRPPGLAALLALAAALLLAGGWLLFTGFKPYDDEGYVLLSLATFARGGRLYTDVFTQYGPFFFWWHDLLHRLLGFEFTQTSARLITLGYWFGAAALCAGVVGGRTRSAGWTLAALGGTFGHLWQMTAEPMHPGGMLAFGVALLAWIGTACIDRDRPRTLAVAVGLIGAALVLTKINVGIFLLAGAGGWLALHATEPFTPRLRAIAVGLALAALPWLLMRSLWSQDWVLTFAVVASTAALSTVVAAAPSSRRWFHRRAWGWLLASGLGLSGMIVALTLAHGTTPADLLEGTVRSPLRHPGVFFFAILWRPGALACALASLALCLAAHTRGWLQRPAFVTGLAAARLLLLVSTILSWFGYLPISSLGLATSYGLSTVWLLVVPLGADAAAHHAARMRAWLGLLLVTQSLHAYPVGGSQIGWGTFLWVPLVMLAAAEAVATLRARAPVLRWMPAAAGFAAVALALMFAQIGGTRWFQSEPLRLPGAESLHVPEIFSARLRMLTLNATVHAGHLFSLPGMYSFNLWSGRPPPTAANATHWFSLLNAAQQDGIRRQLDADPRAVVIVQRGQLRFLAESHLPVGGPLHAYLQQAFAPAVTVGDYEFWTHRGRAIAPLGSALLKVSPGTTGEKFQLNVCAFVPPGAKIARVEWVDCSDEGHPQLRLVLGADNARLELTPLYPNGEARAAPRPAAFPAAAPEFAQLAFYSDAPLATLPRRDSVLRLRAPDGTLVAEAVFAD